VGYFLPEQSVFERIAMPVIKLNDQQFQLRPGTNRLGGGDFVEITISPDVSLGLQAIIEVTGTEGVVIRPAPGKSAAVMVNSVLLTDPTPLLHGDKLEIAGKELSYSDDSKTGATTFIPRAEIVASSAPATPAPPADSKLGEPIQLGETIRGPSAAVADADTVSANPLGGASGGRLVSLADGREYTVPETGLTIGRESGSDVVVVHKQVSRKHAMITPTLRGYELKDLSSNGVFVNGTRVNGTHLLHRADTIRIAKDEFRFYAETSGMLPKAPIQAFAPKVKSSRDTASARRTPSSAHAIASRLAYQDKRRATPHTPVVGSQTVAQSSGGGAGSRFGWVWIVVLVVLVYAAYYMLAH
jgi:pSer/pThr/pTyr-binding forkhead associated (FHA) protein